ncbi:unnamed protein product [Amoebophrya sp. A25]|nr:unnamed protein product [Amoebophrya sp. A25]|eukprot:GSA25T00016559001.1
MYGTLDAMRFGMLAFSAQDLIGNMRNWTLLSTLVPLSGSVVQHAAALFVREDLMSLRAEADRSPDSSGGADANRFSLFGEFAVGSDEGEDDLIAGGSVPEFLLQMGAVLPSMNSTSPSSAVAEEPPQTSLLSRTSPPVDVDAALHLSFSLNGSGANREKTRDDTHSEYLAALHRGSDWREPVEVPAAQWNSTFFMEVGRDIEVEKVKVASSNDAVAFAELSLLHRDHKRGDLIFTCRRAGTAEVTVTFDLSRARKSTISGEALRSNKHKGTVAIVYNKHCAGLPLVGLSLRVDERHQNQKGPVREKTSEGRSETSLVFDGRANGFVRAQEFIDAVHSVDDVAPGFLHSEPGELDSFSTDGGRVLNSNILPLQRGQDEDKPSVPGATSSTALEQQRLSLLTAVSRARIREEKLTIASRFGEQMGALSDMPVLAFESSLSIPVAMRRPSDMALLPLKIEVEGSLSPTLSRISGFLEQGNDIVAAAKSKTQHVVLVDEGDERTTSSTRRSSLALLEEALEVTSEDEAAAETVETVLQAANPHGGGLVSLETEMPDNLRVEVFRRGIGSKEGAQKQQQEGTGGTPGVVERNARQHTSSTAEIFLKCERYGAGVVTLSLVPFPAWQPCAPVRVQRAVFCTRKTQMPTYALSQVVTLMDTTSGATPSSAAEDESSNKSPHAFGTTSVSTSAWWRKKKRQNVSPTREVVLLQGDEEIAQPFDADWNEKSSIFRISDADAADRYAVTCALASADEAVNRARRRMRPSPSKQTSAKNLLEVTTSIERGANRGANSETPTTGEEGNGQQQQQQGGSASQHADGVSLSTLRVEYNCERSGLYECRMDVHWGAVKDDYRGRGLVWRKQCGGDRGVVVISRDATMLGALPLQMSRDGHNHGPRHVLLTLPADAETATFIVHADREMVALTKPPRVHVVTDGEKGEERAESTKNANAGGGGPLSSVRLIRGHELRSIGKDAVLTAAFECMTSNLGDSAASTSSSSSQLVEFALPVRNPLPLDGDALTFVVRKECPPVAASGTAPVALLNTAIKQVTGLVASSSGALTGDASSLPTTTGVFVPASEQQWVRSSAVCCVVFAIVAFWTCTRCRAKVT